VLRRILNLRKALQACWSGVAGRHAAHSIRILRSSAIFDAVWYKEHYQDLRGTSVDAVRHYVVHGVREGRNPHPLSDTRWYLEQNTDVAASDTNPLVHYILYGAKEGRDPHPVFNTPRYIDHHPDIDFTAINPLQHCINLYHAHKRNGHSSISTEGIMWAKAAFAIEHDFTEGKWSYSQVRATILSAFDASYYVSKNHQTYSMDAIDHFVTVGWRHGYDPSPHFSVTHYLSLNPDVGTAGCNPLYHFIMWGRSEGRSSKPARKRHILASNKLAPILFVGHEGIKTGAPVVLLEIIRWYARHTRRPIAVLLMGGGRLASSYAEYADVFVFHSDMHESLNSTAFAAFINRPFVVAYVNSVASGDFHIVYDRFLRERNVPLVLHVHELSNVIREYFDKFTELRARAASFIAASNKVKTCLIDEFGCDASKIFLSHSFIRAIAVAESDVGLFREKARRQLGLGSADFAILGCGTVHERKGPDLFIDTAAKLVASGLVPNARFIWIGDGAEFEQYCSATRDPMLSGRVQFVGFRDDASELLAAADVFYLSSREDPFPLVCLEAAQFAVPSLYFEGATGISEFAGSDAGIGIPPFDTGKVCTTLCSLAQHPVALMRLGQAARARVIAGYMAETKIGQIARHVQNVTRFAPDVSVIVPAYNHANYIHERISSILSVCPKSS
jgi:glycosyltransferase involved in cell wall biosynthesis